MTRSGATRSGATQPGEAKADLRARFLAERRALSAEQVEQRSRAIAKRFSASFVLSPTTYLHVFLPILRHNEVNTWPIVHQLWREHPTVTVGAPVADTQTNRLAHYRLTSTTALVENRWGIVEPSITSDELPPTAFDIVLIPLLAFDQRGHRVGYGRGYYDRFLAECRPDCQKIGLSLFEPVRQISGVEPTDVRLDAGVTPTQTDCF